jgi:hypothetical protein
MRLIWVSVFLFWGVSMPSLAATVADIAVGRVAITEQSLSTQKQAGRDALRQVFIKLSGFESSVQAPEIQRAINNYEQYLVASSYLQQRQQLVFEARFNQDKLISLLKSSGLPIWANLRPSATLWLARQTRAMDIQWLNQNTAGAFNQALQQAAFERGINIVLPLGDLTEAMLISNFDVWTQNSSKLISQSKRYDTPFTISATIKPITDSMRQQYIEEANFLSQQQELEQLFNRSSNAPASVDKQSAMILPSDTDTYQLDWIVSSAQQIDIGKTFLQNEDQAMPALVNQYADMLAVKYALTGETSATSSTSHVVLQNVMSLSDYNDALTLFKGMPQISNISLEGVSGNRAKFLISLNGTAEEFVELVVLDKRVNRPLNLIESSDVQLMWKR